MGQKKSAYDAYRSGQWVLAVLALVTAINLLIDWLSPIRLLLPFSAYLTRFLLDCGRQYESFSLTLAIVLAVLLLFVYIACCIIARRSDRFPAMRAGFALYTLDSLFFFLRELPGIAVGGFRPTHVLELLFRGWILYTLYRAGAVFYDPERKNPNARPPKPTPSRSEQEPTEETDDEDDEGIQW